MKRRDFLLGAAALLAAPRARAALRPRYGGRLIASLPSAPVVIDPAAAWSLADVTLGGLLFDTLYRVVAGRAVPHLAAELPRVEGTTVRVPLLRGVRFHDGAELLAGDVAASLQRATHLPAASWALAGVRSITTEEATVRFELESPRDLALALTTPALAVTRAGKPPSLRAVNGTGAFRLDKLGNNRLELVGHDDHFAGRPFVSRLVLRWFDRLDDEARAYEAGEADVSLAGAVAFAGHQPKKPTASLDGPATRLGFLAFGKGHPLCADVVFRKALSLAIGRAAFKHLGTGERVVPVLQPDGSVAAGNASRARLAEARSLLGARGDGAAPLEVVFEQSRLDDREVAARVVAALDGLGLRASFTPRPAGELGKPPIQLWLGELVAALPAHELALAFAAGGEKAGDPRQFAARLPIVPLYRRAPRAHFATSLSGLGFDALGRPTWADVSRPGGDA